MCGICGKIYASEESRAPDGLIEAMCRALTHRGPDDSGVYRGPGAALGHRRLSIIDLTPEAAQPLKNEDGSLLLVVNGEIYNYRDLRADLEKKHHRFKTRTDSEVILHLYEEYGVDCPSHLEGMFAFAIWDSGRNRLFAARDRAGQKPFYYFYNGEDFSFSSEIASLLKDRNVPRDINEASLFDYFSLSYIPAPQTAFKNLYKLSPAHSLVFDREGVSVNPYWDLSYGKQEFIGSEETLGREVKDRLQKSVTRRLQADVDVGVFLSGGIDSSIIAALAAREDPAVTAFSVSFSDDAYDESSYAAMVAEKLGITHRIVSVTPDVARILPELALHHGEPFADSSSIPTYSISQAASDHVKVILSGEGGDELFGGYNRYRGYYYQTMLRVIPRFILGPLLSVGEMLCGKGTRNSFRDYFRRFLRTVKTRGFNYSDLIFLLTDGDKDSMMQSDFLARLPAGGVGTRSYISHLLIASGSPDLIEMAMAADFFSYLPCDLLNKVDIASMSHGLEVRAPFLDRDLIEYSATIPLPYKINGRKHKYILKRAFKGILPDPVLKRKKMGFAVPLGSYLSGELSGMVDELLGRPEAFVRTLFKPEIIDTVILPEERIHHASLVYAMLMCELWHTTFLE